MCKYSIVGQVVNILHFVIEMVLPQSYYSKPELLMAVYLYVVEDRFKRISEVDFYCGLMPPKISMSLGKAVILLEMVSCS